MSRAVSFSAFPPLAFALRRGGRVILDDRGLHHPRSVSLGGKVVTPYSDVTHLQLGTRTLRLATRRGVFWLPRRAFEDSLAPEHLVRAILERIMSTPQGAVQLARMAEVEELARTSGPLRACGAVAAACVAVALLQTFLGPVVHAAGSFSATLVAHGEAWRLVTANFLHALFPLHLFFNVVGLVGIGWLVERPLGPARTGFVLGVSGLGATAAGLWADYENLVGASGMVAGLAGAVLWLEFRFPERLPAFWRIPRRMFVSLLLADALLPLALPMIAGTAHAGGFLAGAAACALCSGPRLRREPAPAAVLGADALLAGLVAAALVASAPLVRGEADAWAQHAARIAEVDALPPDYWNAAAWFIAVAPDATPAQLERAEVLARRAVKATGASDPNILDTLAEVQFQLGRVEAALVTIERAIALAPDEPYFREQRRRFLGERPAHDRPPPPRVPPRPAPPEEEGVRA